MVHPYRKNRCDGCAPMPCINYVNHDTPAHLHLTRRAFTSPKTLQNLTSFAQKSMFASRSCGSARTRGWGHWLTGPLPQKLDAGLLRWITCPGDLGVRASQSDQAANANVQGDTVGGSLRARDRWLSDAELLRQRFLSDSAPAPRLFKLLRECKADLDQTPFVGARLTVVR